MICYWQVDALQSFKLPRPVICIGGIVRIELLGRVQKQKLARLYYIWWVFRYISVMNANLHPCRKYPINTTLISLKIILILCFNLHFEVFAMSKWSDATFHLFSTTTTFMTPSAVQSWSTSQMLGPLTHLKVGNLRHKGRLLCRLSLQSYGDSARDAVSSPSSLWPSRLIIDFNPKQGLL